MNKANLYKPIHSTNVGPIPIVVKAIVTPRADALAEGMPISSTKTVDYVLYEALSDDLKRRIELEVQALMTAK